MKKILICLILAVTMLFTFTSCEKSSDVYYYGYFGDTALLLLYSSNNNSLYEINIPLEQIILWGSANGIENMGVAMHSYVGLQETGFMLGNPQVLTALRDILNALSNSDKNDSASRLEVLVNRPELLSNSRLLENLNRLCGTDFGPLAKAISSKSVDVYVFDAGTFLDTNNIIYSQSYFTRWLSQVLGE